MVVIHWLGTHNTQASRVNKLMVLAPTSCHYCRVSNWFTDWRCRDWRKGVSWVPWEEASH